MLLRGAVAGPEVALVVRVHAVGDRVEAQLVAKLCHHFEQLGLAEVTAVRPVRAIASALHLVRVDEAVRERELRDDFVCELAVALGVRGRHRRDRERAGAERAVRRPGEVARIHAAAERDHHAARGAQARKQRVLLRERVGGHVCHGRAR